MAEPSKEKLEVENPQENQVNNQAQNISPINLNEQWDSLQGLALINPGLKESPDYKALETKMLEAAKTKGLIKEGGGAGNGGAAATTTTEEEEEEEKPEDKKDKKDVDTKPKNVFNIGLKKTEKKVNPVIEKLDAETLKGVLKPFGTEDPNKFFEEIVPKWRQDSQDLATTREDLEALQQELGNMPDDIKLIINAYAGGHDWKEVINVGILKPDFNQAFDKLDKENVVKFYYPDKYKSLKQKLEENDEFEEEDFNEHLSTLHAAAKPLFEKDKGLYEKQRADIFESSDKADKLWKSSVASSVEALKKEYPDFSATELQKVRSFLVNGEIESLLKDKNGSCKPTAAKVVALALFGEDLIKDLLEQAEKKGVSSAEMEIATRGKKSIVSSKAVENAKEKVMEAATSHLKFSQPEKNPYL
jgi:hypothetical protein